MGSSAPDMKKIRTFIAFDLPDDILEIIGETQKKLNKNGLRLKWLPVSNIHLTIKFIGDMPINRVENVTEMMAVSAGNFGPISIFARSMGVFPGLRRPNVLWLGIDGALDRLVTFQQALDTNLASIGLPPEKRPFRGHLTIGRVKGKINTEQLKDGLRFYYDFQTRRFALKEIKLYQSELKPTGAEYTCLKSVSLSGLL